MTGTSWCCAQPWMVNDSFHCSYSKSAALAPTTERSSCHQAEGKTIATDVLKNRSKKNVSFVMHTLCVVLFFCRDTSGQGRFCTIFRSYSRGAQGVILVYDITNRWSFDGIDRWIKEIDEHAPGVPKILVGNRLHLAYKRQVTTEQAQAFAERLGVTFFEVSPLCNFNITESFTELARIVLMRHGMERLWRPNKVLSLQDLCCRSIVSCTPVHLVDKLPLPIALKSHLKSFSMANGLNARMMHGRSYSVIASSAKKRNGTKKSKIIYPPLSPSQNCARTSCKIS
uniref:small monomeric GTPase n=1 Tax=Cyprinus carpio carpio TaxID=630221 RepID=A0A9J7XEY1_CYPCA